MLQIDRGVVAYGAPDLIDILVVHDGEKPGAQIGAGLPQMFLTKRPRKRFL